ncbi:MAG TPA: hypothetical protein VF980_05955 [Thermoanaerobaculia bacterium]
MIGRSRALIVVRDVNGLRRVACACHEILFDAYSRYLSGLGHEAPS